MNILDKIKSFFNKNKSSEPSPTLDDSPVLISDGLIPLVEYPQTTTEVPLVETQQLVPHWLENEDALRDEGVIFGLSDSKPEEKISIIRNYFSNQTANLEKAIEQFSEKIGEINLLIGQKETRIEELKSKTKILEESMPNLEHHLPRTSVGLVLSILMATGNYFLIENTLQKSFVQNSWIISLGVFLAGMFNLFNPKSLFHEKTSFSWRQLLEEVGMPLAAALFVFVQAYVAEASLLKASALFLFVFFLFLFSGKLLLGNLTVFKSDFNIVWDNRTLRQDKVNKSKDWDDEVQQLTKEIDEHRINKWQILPNLNKAEAELSSLNAKRDMMIKLFESEFHLARSYKEKLSEKDFRSILK